MTRLAALLLLPLAACGSGDDATPGITGTGSGTTRSFAASGFDAIAIKGSGNVDVRVGGGFSVRAEGEPSALDHLKITREGDTLNVGWRKGNWGVSSGHVKVYVTLPRLTGAVIAGSGSMAVDRVDGGSFKADIAGSGDLSVKQVAADAVELNVGGSGDFTAAGTARSFDVSIGGSGNVRAAGLRTDTVEVSIAGAGDVHVNASRHAKISIVGGGDVVVDGTAKCDVSKMGGGDVRCGG